MPKYNVKKRNELVASGMGIIFRDGAFCLIVCNLLHPIAKYNVLYVNDGFCSQCIYDTICVFAHTHVYMCITMCVLSRHPF